MSKYELAKRSTLIRLCDEKDREIESLKQMLEDIMQCVEHLGMNSSDGHTLSWVDDLCAGVEKRLTEEKQ